ncbi:hypothetical protein DFJ67_5287 [Asanoa ferruginea]|uniref:Uncharacterized protein n=1 Tax=Asanoa ferruginea TaxID=53367 RepID=A0A3D9ZRJ9_9ACTN|nr:hypothetical protein [Asanoa ferruginea]REF99254.1 hypothetical protein DFJ67_5287 [Asanoa ferruginea]GIF45852.1 hypothetical protein Afe04nite_03910 [Asanoa ferruginea]
MNENAVVVFVLVTVVGLTIVGLVFLARRGPAATEKFEVPVRCRDGHVFTTVWVPGISFKAIRLGPLRLQWCPVGEHRTIVTPVPWTRLSDQERWMAAHYHDSGMP